MAESKQSDSLLKRPLYVYDLPPEVLDSLSLKRDTDDATSSSSSAAKDQRPTAKTPARTTTQTPPSDNAIVSAVGSQSCSLCGGLSFPTVEEQRGHLKSDLHHYNLKLKLRGQAAVSEAEFERLVDNLDESLSGSDSDESEEDEASDAKESTLVALLKRQTILADKANKNRRGATTRNNDGDDEEGDEDSLQQRRGGGPGASPLIWFSSRFLPENTYFGMYKAILRPEELAREDKVTDVVRSRQLAPILMPKAGAAPTDYKGPHVFLCMIGGGHFAAMVVALPPRRTKHGTSATSSAGTPLNREAIVLAHKTFHRYTTRRKQGGSQSANDNAKGAAHSAGSSLRRYNEQALVEDVRALLTDWKALLDTSDLLFVRATGVVNRRTLFGPYEGQVLRADDGRLRGFPFSTRRATQNELMRSFIELTRFKVREILPQDVRPTPEQTRTATPERKAATPPPPRLTEEEEVAQLHTTQMQALVRRSKLPALLSYITNNSLSPDFRLLLPPPQHHEPHHHAPTLLHLAASLNSAPLVSGLLVRGGADPTVRNGEGKTPFELAGDRATRDAFRVARAELGEDRWSWGDGDGGARVPPPLSKQEAEKRAESEKQKESERKKAEEDKVRAAAATSADKDNTAGKKKKGLLEATRGRLTPQDKRDIETRDLTPQQKMQLERERRARAAEERFRRAQDGQ